MSDDEARGDVPAALRAGTGPRHAAPKKPLLTRLHVPAGKAIALAAMPTAVLMGMGFTPTLARAEDHSSAPNSQLADEYKNCVAALEDDDASASPSPSASSPSASESAASDTKSDGAKSDAKAGKGDSGSSDSGSDDKAEPSPSPSASASAGGTAPGAASPSPSPSASAGGTSDGGGLLETIGDALNDIFTGGKTADGAKGAEPSPSPSASASGAVKGPAEPSSSPSPAVSEGSGGKADDGKGKGKADDEDKASPSASPSSSPSPSPSASDSTDVDDCNVSTKAVADGRDNRILLPEDPWILEASGLTLEGADYQGIVEVTTSSGRKKKVLKYVVSKATKIDDLHQIVHDKNSGKTYHVRSAKGKQSVITGGQTTMYTESISGNLFGLLPVTFSPDNPPPLNLSYIYFSHVKVVQAGQFGGTLTIPGMNQSIT